MNFTNQAVGAIMMALQKGILEKEDVSKMLRDFDLQPTTEGLIVQNPPVVHAEAGKGEEDANGDN
jgi:hypothetical protein